jgi:glycosyltransferase involved in cell wall biosynthesis
LTAGNAESIFTPSTLRISQEYRVNSAHQSKHTGRSVGILTYDLSEVTSDFLESVAVQCPHALKCYPVFYHQNQDRCTVPHLPSTIRGRYLSLSGQNGVPEGTVRNWNLRAAIRCAIESDVVVLMGLQAVSALVCASLTRLLGKPLISVNQTLPYEVERKRRGIIRAAKRFLLTLSTVVIYQTEVSRITLQQLYKVPESRLCKAIFSSGYEEFEKRWSERTTRTNSLPRTKLAAGHRHLVAFVGNLHPFKGVRDLINAVPEISKHADVRVLFAGPEELRNGAGGTVSDYLDLAESLGVRDRVEFLGELRRDDLVWLYEAADVVALPSYRDTFGKVFVEGALAGCALISTDACGASGTVIRDGENGFVIHSGDIQGLAQAIVRILDPETLPRMQARSRELVQTECDPQSEIAGYCAAIDTALGRA